MDGDRDKENGLQSAPSPQSHRPHGPHHAKAGPGGLDSLFQAHHRRIYRAAYRVTGNAADAEDVLQTVFLRLARRGEEHGLSDSPAGYLHRAAVNAGLDLLRSRARAPTVELEESQEVPGDERQPTERRTELRQRLRLALATLSPRVAEIFTLRYIEGYGNSEIAAMLGSSRTTIGVILHRARKSLKKELGSTSPSSVEE